MSTPSKDSEGSIHAKSHPKDTVAQSSQPNVPSATSTTTVSSTASLPNAPHIAEDSMEPQVSVRPVRLLQWFIFTVLIAVLPIVINAIRIAAKPNPGESLSFSTVVATHGELALVCAAITADAIGDIFMTRQARSFAILSAFGSCCLIFFLSASIFVIAQIEKSNLDLVAFCSYFLFVFTLGSGLSCKYHAVGT